jgi:hypothetical protein
LPAQREGSTEVTSVALRDDLREPIKVGFDVAQGSVTNAMVKRSGLLSQERTATFRATTRQTLPPWTRASLPDRQMWFADYSS